jgi:hypothetical protein
VTNPQVRPGGRQDHTCVRHPAVEGNPPSVRHGYATGFWLPADYYKPAFKFANQICCGTRMGQQCMHCIAAAA